MNERILEAISKLKKEQDSLGVSIKTFEKMLNDRNSLSMQKALITVSEELAKYTIHNGNWYYSGKDTGIQAEAHDGKDGERGPQGIPGKSGKDGRPGRDGKDGKNGKDGRPGRDGKDGKPGKDGRPGRDGKDGISPELKIGKVEVSPEYGGALAKLRPGKDNILYLDLTLPRGPQGFTGFDGKDAKINGENTIEIKPGTNVTITQDKKTLTINSTGGGEVDLTDYVKNTDYASSAKGGVFRVSSTYGVAMSQQGILYGAGRTYEQYSSAGANLIIAKGTLENVITGKGLVANTDYATPSVGGVLKVSNGDYGITVDEGVLKGTVRTYAQYNDMSSKGIVCKGTLENVLTGKGLNPIVELTQAQYDALTTKDSNTYYYIVEE